MARHQRSLSNSRRSFCRTFSAVLIAPCIAIAQASKAIRRIGVLEPGAAATSEWLSRQAEPLQELGWVEGKNLHVERRYANGRSEALQPLAEELVRAQVEIIVTAGTPATLAAKRATTTIPIVFRVADAVLVGLVDSLARPSGNVTGYSDAAPEVTAKYLTLLKELLPGRQRVGVLWEAGGPFNRAFRDQFERICQSLDLVPTVVEIAAASEIDGAIKQLVRQRTQALVMQSDTIVSDHSTEIIDAATRAGLPTITDDSAFVRQGALIAYSTTWAEQFRLRAEYIDRILRGAKPADLPVQQPTKFELLINLKTARSLGIPVPTELLLRADEVIQ